MIISDKDVYKFMEEHPNCVVVPKGDGTFYADYDFDSQSAVSNVANIATDIPSLTDTPLVYSKTYEEEMTEQESVREAEYFLNKLGITVKTNYGYYRNTYDILKDIGDAILKFKTIKYRF